MPSNPFHAIFLIESNTGLTLASRKFSNYDYDEDLISGMFKALESFISHLSYSNQFERIQEINFQGSCIIFDRRGPVTAVAITQKMDCTVEHQILKSLLDRFINDYGVHLEYFRGNIAPFQDFQRKLNTISFDELYSLGEPPKLYLNPLNFQNVY
jgi:hypothetical protein